jgi:hypothetical protein
MAVPQRVEFAGHKANLPFGVIAMPVGLSPAANGEPATGVIAPFFWSM